MRAPFAWWWPLLAALFATVAIVMSRNYGAAIPAAVAAVIVAAIAVADAVRRTGTTPTVSLTSRAVTTSDVRDWLAAGKLGREDLVLLLDRLERRAARPEMPIRSSLEIGMITSLGPAEFLQYLTARLDALEGTV